MHYFPSILPPHPVSDTDTTDIADTDFDSDSHEGYSDDTPHSAGSLATESVTTALTPDDIGTPDDIRIPDILIPHYYKVSDDLRTPDSTGLTGFHFQIDESPVKGPVGPHLFRIIPERPDSRSSFVLVSSDDEVPSTSTTPLSSCASRLEPERKDTPVPKHNTSTPHTKPATDVREPNTKEQEVADWTTQDVVTYMQRCGFDEAVVEKFFINDITGSILLELQAEDLKELDIQSFGKRHRLMACIKDLRSKSATPACDSQSDVEPISREDTSTPQSTAAQVGVSCSSPEPCESKERSKSSHHKRRRRHKRRDGTEIVPEDSASIVAIEQLLPKLHTCSKGENCRKWQKQQTKLGRMVKDLPIDGMGGSIIITGDPGNATTAQNLNKTPKSEVTPSIIASSDALGQNPASDNVLSQDKLHGVKLRDPQENVRNFLNFQRLSKLQPATDPATPPQEHLSPGTTSPTSIRANATLSENLRHLPRLRIPSTHVEMSSTVSPNYSAQRTITPSILQKKQPFSHRSRYPSPSPSEVTMSPSDFYRIDPYYGRSTPLSEMDVPVTAIPLGPVSRNISQSVPPNMRFGGQMHFVPDIIPRPASTKAENVCRKGGIWSSQGIPKLGSLEERSPLPPIETPEDMEKTPRAAHCKGPFSPNWSKNVLHSGWMKKRKTTRFLRHEWEEHHFTLRGTQLAMYPDAEASRQDSKALEYIDVDDYAVACSSLASSSKLTAAFKKTVLKRRNDSRGDAAFTFSLIPSPTTSTFDRKLFFTNGPKAHHFAVTTREQRIDWMRELMLAKALRKNRENGASVSHNGNFI
ncbi:hypothetical protein CBS147343_7197 [Aspergillus niger]|nr:hypothetical protein CBS147343_7197 [Aspergillus niger]